MNLRLSNMIWDELIIYVKAAWNRVLEQINSSSFSAVAMLQRFDKPWRARNVLCRRHNLHIEWNCERLRS